MMKIKVVTATRATRDNFFSSTALGRSLSFYRAHPLIEIELFPENSVGLPTLYNRAIDSAADNPCVLAFVHDDVHLCDFFWMNNLAQAVDHFDVVGIAGNVRRVARQPAWALVGEPDRMALDERKNLSGIIGHGTGYPPANLSLYGAPLQPCKLLDGVFLAAKSETLLRTKTRFDPRFAFHFYDMDFCRQAELNKLRVGTWPLSLVHESTGGFGTPAWKAGYALYLEKYGE